MGKTIYVDTNTLIFALETPVRFPGLQTNFVQPLRNGELQIVTGWITLAEVLVKPIKSGDKTLESYYRRLVHPSVFTMINVDEEIANAAADMRAKHPLRLPEAIHIATGQAYGCTLFLTNDLEWAKAGVTVIDPASLP